MYICVRKRERECVGRIIQLWSQRTTNLYIYMRQFLRLCIQTNNICIDLKIKTSLLSRDKRHSNTCYYREFAICSGNYSLSPHMHTCTDTKTEMYIIIYIIQTHMNKTFIQALAYTHKNIHKGISKRDQNDVY